MELINRYVYAVTHRLPEKQRADIERELRGLIEDMLDERAEGETPSPQVIEEVLRELGNPKDMADRYRGEARYLIGPGLFSQYVTVLRIVWIAIGIAVGVGFAIQAFMGPGQVLEHFVDGIVSLMLGLAQGFVWVTVIFGVIEYRGMNGRTGAKAEHAWSPADLPELPDHLNRINRSEPIVSIVFSALLVAWFSFSVEYFGIWRLAEDSTRSVIAFFDAEAFNRFVPLIWIFLAVNVLKESMKLIMRTWSVRLIGMEIFVSLVFMALAAVMLADASVWNADFMLHLTEAGIVTAGSEGYETVDSIWQRLTVEGGSLALVGLVTFIQVISLLVKAYRLKAPGRLGRQIER